MKRKDRKFPKVLKEHSQNNNNNNKNIDLFYKNILPQESTYQRKKKNFGKKEIRKLIKANAFCIRKYIDSFKKKNK